jgi:hypothetical protein
MVVKIEPVADASPGLGHQRVVAQIDLFILQTPPQTLDEDVVVRPAGIKKVST